MDSIPSMASPKKLFAISGITTAMVLLFCIRKPLANGFASYFSFFAVSSTFFFVAALISWLSLKAFDTVEIDKFNSLASWVRFILSYGLGFVKGINRSG